MNPRLLRVPISCLATALWLCSSSAPAEPATGRLVGIVSDRTGAVIAAALVEVRRPDTTVVASTLTDARGRYAFDALPVGRCSVVVQAPGFARAIRTGADVVAAAESGLDFVLELTPRETYVEVTAGAADRPLETQTDPRTPRQPIPAHDGADYLKTIPGFSVIRKGGSDGDPVLRGMAGSRLGILLDGENVLGGCGNRMDPPTAYAFPEAYDRITVIKGPQTVVHGPGNSAGVVLFERQRERYDEPALRAYASPTFGSFGRNDQVADVRAGERHGYVQASATRSAMSDYQDGRGAPVHSHYERWSASGAVGWTPDSATRLELSGARSDGEAAYADRMMDGVRFSRDNVGLRFERRALASWMDLEAQGFYNYVDHVMDNYSLRAFTPSMMMPNPSASNPDRRTVGARVQASLRLGGSGQARLGVDWQDNRHSVRGSSNQAVEPFEDHARVRDATFENAGVFAELTRQAGAKGRFVAGARVDWWTAHDERQTITVGMGMGSAMPNPTAGLSRSDTLPSGFLRYERDLGSGTTLFAALGHAQRAPDYWELVSKESTTSLSAFETLPEKTTQLDTGVLFRSGGVSGSVSIFANAISDFILIESGYAKPSAPMTGAGMGAMGGMSAMSTREATVTRNVDASSWGGEATLAWAATHRLKLDGSLAYVHGQNSTDDHPLAQLPPLEGRISAQYGGDRWSVGALARLVAAQNRYALQQGNIVGQDLGPTSAFSVLSLNGAWRPGKRLRFAAGVDNVLDEAYAEFVSRGGAEVPGFTTTTRVNEPGRTFWIKADLTY